MNKLSTIVLSLLVVSCSHFKQDSKIAYDRGIASENYAPRNKSMHSMSPEERDKWECSRTRNVFKDMKLTDGLIVVGKLFTGNGWVNTDKTCTLKIFQPVFHSYTGCTKLDVYASSSDMNPGEYIKSGNGNPLQKDISGDFHQKAVIKGNGDDNLAFKSDLYNLIPISSTFHPGSAREFKVCRYTQFYKCNNVDQNSDGENCEEIEFD